MGDTGTYGLHHLVYEVVDNAVDEALAGVCTDIQLVIHVDNSISVKDNGRGIPIGPHPTVQGMDTVDVVMTKLHAGGKFENSAYKVSGGLHGVGVSCVNALSEWLRLEIQREGKVYEQQYARGVPQQQVSEIGVTDLRGTKVSFKPDPTIFEVVEFNFDTLSQRLRELAFLNAGLHISITDERTSKSHEFKRPGIVRVFCNIHPTMSAIIAVLPTPWYVLTKPAGDFQISNVPPGEYSLRIFYERALPDNLKFLEHRITVPETGLTLPLISISETGYIPLPHLNKHGQEYPKVGNESAYPGAPK